MASHLTDAPPQPRVAISQRQAAVIAGLAYAFIIVLALFANFLVLDRLTEPDDAAATVRNITDSEVLFRSGIAAFIIVLIADVVVAWGLYVFFQRTSRELSLFAAWFRLVYVAIAAAALLNLLLAVKLVDDTGYTTALEKGQRDAQVMLSLDAYLYGWRIGLVAFGVHLLLLGFVVVQSDYAPRILGMLVALAGLGYVVTMFASVLLSNFEDHKDLFLMLLAVVALPGEFGLTAWLLWRGGKGHPTTGQPREKAYAATTE
jgi:Domain of unknown function (DUF4386)